ncbi:hypothetical protein AT6N2_C0670 [Agrobacterium tumefaciens]|nr:hypothetical protein AT6N2_C0670 [Agrobacterium tumefaciens]
MEGALRLGSRSAARGVVIGRKRLQVSAGDLLQLGHAGGVEVAVDAGCPDVGGLHQFAGGDRTVLQQLLASFAAVERRNGVQFLNGESACVGQCGFTLQIGAARCKLKRLGVDGRRDRVLNIGRSLNEFGLQTLSEARQNVVKTVGDTKGGDGLACGSNMRFGNFLGACGSTEHDAGNKDRSSGSFAQSR